MQRHSEKDEYEEEEEEVERNVRESPEDKPPRRDKERRTVEDSDPDVDEDPDTENDDDLSMNYKDIGGSVAEKYRTAIKKAQDDENSDEEDKEEEEEEGSSETDEKGEEDGEEGGKKVEEEGDKVEEDTLDQLLQVDNGDSDKIDRVVEHALTGPETDLSKPVNELARDWYSSTPEELSSVFLSDDAEEKEKEAAKRAVKMKKAPLPPDWKGNEVFDSGVITLQARQEFREHMKNWSPKDFEDNLDKIKQRSISESITDGSDLKDDYYEALIDLVEEQKDKMLNDKHDPVDDVDDLFPEGVGKADGLEFSEDYREALKKRAQTWRKRIRETPKEKVESLLKDVRSELNEMDDQLSAKYAYYSVLWDILKGDLVMKKAKIASRVKKKAEYRGLPGPVPEDEGRPPQPKWRKPDPLQLDTGDYLSILREAQNWMKKDVVAPLVDHNREMACRIALDYAIFDLNDGVYAGVVDQPTYNDLLELLIES